MIHPDRGKARAFPSQLTAGLIAPCGMNCGLCKAHWREREPCPGCRVEDASKPPTRLRCRIKLCEAIARNRSSLCFECDRFPCAPLKKLDQRYRTNYGMSMIANLEMIREQGMAAFLRKQRALWKCGKCGGIVSVHGGFCTTCGAKKRRLRCP
jgi:hypothetical protein